MADYGWTTGQSRICEGCGERVVLDREPLWLDTSNKRTWHFRCHPNKVIEFVSDGCEYCRTVEAAMEDAREAHGG